MFFIFVDFCEQRKFFDGPLLLHKEDQNVVYFRDMDCDKICMLCFIIGVLLHSFTTVVTMLFGNVSWNC